MKASTIISDDMSLDEKLAAIDAAMNAAMAVANDDTKQKGLTGLAAAAPVDPADMFMCVGCQ
jgi:hypothetical protein